MTMTVRRALIQGQTVLPAVSDAPALDVQWLLLFILGHEEVGWLFAHANYLLTSREERLFLDLLAERASGKPLAYILGFWEFYGRRFMVNEQVLIPRPSTELLIEDTMRVIDALFLQLGRPLRIADIGTGSGCIAITLLLEQHNNSIRSFYATDISRAALSVAEHNAQLHGVADRITFFAGDMLDPLRGRSVDLVVSNPPYIPSSALARASLSSATLGLTFEPHEALDGGSVGLKYVRTLARCGKPAVIETSGGRCVVLR